MSKLKASQAKAVRELLEELDVVRAWFDDTGYPQSSRLHFEETVKVFEDEFAVQKDMTPASEDATIQQRRPK